MPPVVALAGRRVDPPNAAEPRFPLDKAAMIRDRLRTLFAERRAAALVCSAACGADLVALEAAEALGVRRRVVLPFDPAAFRRSSVTDRPGDWGPRYDRVVDAVARAGDLVVLEGAGEGAAAYAAANERILDEALRLAGVAEAPGSEASGPVSPETALGVIVWDARPRGGDDATERFAASARRRGLAVEEVLTT